MSLDPYMISDLRKSLEHLLGPDDPGEEAVGIEVYGTGQPGFLIDAILARVRDRLLDSIVLSREEAAVLARAATKWANAIDSAAALNELTEPQIQQVFADDAPRLRVLAARLEATTEGEPE